MTIMIFDRSTYFLHSLDYSSNFAIRGNEDFTNVVKAIEYNLITTRVTSTAYIQEDDLEHFDLFALLQSFIECFKQFDSGYFINFDHHQTIFTYLFIPTYFFGYVKLLLVPLTDFRNHFLILKNLYRILL
jgi:hypothetical protein